MTSTGGNKSTNIWQYINTALLTLIGVFALLIFNSVSNIRKDQTQFATELSKFSTELVRIKTIQDINTSAIKDIDTRVTTLERNYLDYIKSWTDLNYVRKPQK